MDASPTCSECGKRMWLLVVVETLEGTASHFECLDCDGKPAQLGERSPVDANEVLSAPSVSL
jgi:hypothetical protein